MDWTDFDITVETELGNFRLVCYGHFADTNNQCPYIQALKDNEDWGRLTVNILPWIPLNDREILVKTWSENRTWAPLILENGPFRDTGRRVPSGFVHAEVWEYVEKLEVPF